MDLTPKVQFQNIAELTCHCHVKPWAATCSNRWQKFIDRPGLRLMVMAVCPRPPRQVMQHDSYDRRICMTHLEKFRLALLLLPCLFHCTLHFGSRTEVPFAVSCKLSTLYSHVSPSGAGSSGARVRLGVYVGRFAARERIPLRAVNSDGSVLPLPSCWDYS